MVLGKKAIFFSLLALVLSGFIVLFFTSSAAEPIDREYQMQLSRMNYFSSFVSSFDTFIDMQFRKAAYDALDVLLQDFLLRGPFPSSRENLEDCLLQGSFSALGRANLCTGNYSFINQSWSEDGFLYLLSQEYPSWDINISIIDIKLDQQDTYSFDYNLSLTADISSSSFSWSRSFDISDSISLIGVTDPATLDWSTPRTIELFSALGTSYSADFFANHYTLKADFNAEGTYFRDTSAPGFFDILDGRAVDQRFNPGDFPFGYNSFIPELDEGGEPNYVENLPSLTSFRAPHQNIFLGPSELRRFDADGFSLDQLFPREYIVNVFGSEYPDDPILDVDGFCDAAGCW